MKAVQNLMAITVAVALLAAAGFGGYWMLASAALMLRAFDTRTLAMAAAVSLAVLALAWVVSSGIAAAHREGRAATFHDEKAAAYQLLLDFWTNRLQLPSPRSEALRADFLGRELALDRLLALYGGARVIRAHAVLRETAAQRGDAAALRRSYRRMLLAVRADLGSDTPAQVADDLERLLAPPHDGTPLHAASA
jgi:hypothetical protein